MVVGCVSGSIDHRHLGVRASECFGDVPARQGVGQSYIGDQKIDFLGVLKCFKRAGACRRLQHRPSFLPKVSHYVFADHPIVFDHDNGDDFPGS